MQGDELSGAVAEGRAQRLGNLEDDRASVGGLANDLGDAQRVGGGGGGWAQFFLHSLVPLSDPTDRLKNSPTTSRKRSGASACTQCPAPSMVTMLARGNSRSISGRSGVAHVAGLLRRERKAPDRRIRARLLSARRARRSARRWPEVQPPAKRAVVRAGDVHQQELTQPVVGEIARRACRRPRRASRRRRGRRRATRRAPAAGRRRTAASVRCRRRREPATRSGAAKRELHRHLAAHRVTDDGGALDAVAVEKRECVGGEIIVAERGPRAASGRDYVGRRRRRSSCSAELFGDRPPVGRGAEQPVQDQHGRAVAETFEVELHARSLGAF